MTFSQTPNLACQKYLFSLPEQLHYLNCAYMSPLSQQVEAAGIQGIQRKRNPSTIKPKDFFNESAQVRERFARLVNAGEEQRIAILPSVSYGMAIVARNLQVESGQNIVVIHEQFPSNVYPWQRLCQAGATLRTVVPPNITTGRGQAWNEGLLDAIDSSTALVALPHFHWTDGTRFDLTAIGRKAREVGAALVVDGTQSIGAFPFDVQQIQPDALICGAYKFLLGPYSIALGYFGSRFDDGIPIEENWINRLGSEDFTRLVDYESRYQPGAIRYDVGERSNPILLPMVIAALDHLLEWKPERIQAYSQELIRPLRQLLQPLGYWIEDASWCGAHLFGIRIPSSFEMQAVQSALAAHRVAVSVRGNALRVSPNVYNDVSDITALAEALTRQARVVLG